MTGASSPSKTPRFACWRSTSLTVMSLPCGLSDRTAEALDVSTLELGPDGALTARVKNGRAKARFSQDAQFALGELVESTDGGSVLHVGSRVLPLPVALKT